ncbi:MAG: hypothetical protein EP329_01925 [Deltaproteobacteria bacterium]|nr:MAG: hypothetical protein EP329_01925 [Deltaproteobacteria bacterium]
MRSITCLSLVALLSLGAASARAGEVVASTTPDEGAALGLDANLGFATAYIFRGLNVFQEEGQMDANMLFAPGITWAIGDTGLTVGYLGSFQLTGHNIGAVIDAGLGAEQDLYVTWERELTPELTFGAALTAYLYPGADPDVCGARDPLYLEPAASLSYATFVDVGLWIGYFWGVQDKPAIRGISYLYVNPSLSKSVPLGGPVALDVKLAYGFKLFQEGNDGMSNVHDLLLAARLPISLGDRYTITPGLATAWTNIEGGDFGDGLAVVGGLDFSASF